jgi:hypothetical protein
VAAHGLGARGALRAVAQTVMKCSHCHGTGEEPAINGAVPRSVALALAQCPKLGQVPKLQTAEYWRAEYRACPDVEHSQQLFMAEAWLTANPGRAPRKDLARFVHNWLSKAQAEAHDG